ncbi:UNVERIFIED_CONTAM: nitroreductase [Williamsia faeni]
MPVHPILAGRWSARGYDATATISAEHLGDILEAGRWAPTGGGNQPVRFVVGVRGDDTFDGLVDGLKRGNQSWAPAAAALILLCTADVPDEPKMQDYATLDVGLAASQMITQAQVDGWNAHPMGGFRAEAMIERFAIPPGRRPLLVVAIGRLSDPTSLRPEIAERDSRERTRLPLHQVAFSDSWGSSYTSEP